MIIVWGKVMNLSEIISRMELIEFKQELLFNNTSVDRLLFETNVNRKQYDTIMDFMEECRDRIYKGEKIKSAEFERRIYEIVPEHDGDYHFCESLALTFFDEGRWTEVFRYVYGDNPKFADRIKAD